ncbi:hypothetical protein MXB_1712 [Myxobolus squamalis]|nr:hypothetical protein MXB_1712 [Myxobolus squamalis]
MIYEFMIEKAYIDSKKGNEILTECVSKTQMISYLISLLSPTCDDQNLPKDLSERQSKAAKRLGDMKAKFDPIGIILSSEKFNSLVEIYSTDHDSLLKHCMSCFDLPKNFLSVIYEYSILLYDTGSYMDCDAVLNLYACLIKNDSQSYLEILWGKLSCYILINDIEAASDTMEILQGCLEKFTLTKPILIYNRAYLLHFMLFVSFKDPNLIEHFIHLCMRMLPYKHTIETVCPHLIRYLVIAYIVFYQDELEIQPLVDLIVQEEHNYSDCVTLFVQSLFQNYDIDGGIKFLKASLIELGRDFFVSEVLEIFELNAYFHLFKFYCKVHLFISKPFMCKYFEIDEKLCSLVISRIYEIDEDETDETIKTELPSNNIYKQIYSRTVNLYEGVHPGNILPVEEL